MAQALAMSRAGKAPPLSRTLAALASPPAGTRTAQIIARIRAIPEGFVRTYGDIDRAAPRAVGRVLATAREDLPWHRVVRADGSAPMGALQLRRLRREGVPIRNGRVDLKKARLPY